MAPLHASSARQTVPGPMLLYSYGFSRKDDSSRGVSCGSLSTNCTGFVTKRFECERRRRKILQDIAATWTRPCFRPT